MKCAHPSLCSSWETGMGCAQSWIFQQLWGLAHQQSHIFCQPGSCLAVNGGCAASDKLGGGSWEISPGSQCAGAAVVSAVTSLLCARIFFSSFPELSRMVQSKKQLKIHLQAVKCGGRWEEVQMDWFCLICLAFKQFLVLFKPPPFPPKEMKCRSFQIFMTLNDQSWEEIFL